MSLSGLWLRHGLRGGGAAPETEDVVVATRLFRCPLWHLRRLGCALHPKPPRRVATGPAVFCRKAGGRARRGHPDSRQAGRPPRTGGLLGRGVKPGRGRCVGADADRGVGAKAAVGGRSQRPRGRTPTGERRGQFRQRRQPEEDRVDPPRPEAAFGRPSRQGLLVRERPREGRDEV